MSDIRICEICHKEIDMDKKPEENSCFDRVKAMMTVDMISNKQSYYHVECYESK